MRCNGPKPAPVEETSLLFFIYQRGVRIVSGLSPVNFDVVGIPEEIRRLPCDSKNIDTSRIQASMNRVKGIYSTKAASDERFGLVSSHPSVTTRHEHVLKMFNENT